MPWGLGDAKNRFSKLVNRAVRGEPQVVVRRRDAVVVWRGAITRN
jgi:prevent-host-death family protein